MSIGVTCKEEVFYNLYNIANYIDIDSTIIGIKYQVHPNKVLIRGEYKKSIKTFPNQVSLKICLSNKRNVNVKIFRNASLQITGCREESEGKQIWDIIQVYLNKLDKKWINITLEKTIDDNYLTNDDMLYSSNLKQVIGYKIDYLHFNINNDTVKRHKITEGITEGTTLKDVWISTKVIHNKRNIYSIDSEYLGVSKVVLFNNAKKLFKHDNLFIDYNSNKIIIKKDESTQVLGNIVYDLKESRFGKTTLQNDFNYSCSSFIFREKSNLNPTTNILSINTSFKIGFKLNRQVLFDILKDSNETVFYNPLEYLGIVLNYFDENTSAKYTFIIFHTGSVITSGFKDINKINEFTLKFTRFILKYKQQIIVN